MQIVTKIERLTYVSIRCLLPRLVIDGRSDIEFLAKGPNRWKTYLGTPFIHIAHILYFHTKTNSCLGINRNLSSIV